LNARKHTATVLNQFLSGSSGYIDEAKKYFETPDKKQQKTTFRLESPELLEQILCRKDPAFKRSGTPSNSISHQPPLPPSGCVLALYHQFSFLHFCFTPKLFRMHIFSPISFFVFHFLISCLVMLKLIHLLGLAVSPNVLKKLSGQKFLCSTERCYISRY
jgi:hypothetical protein